MLRWPSSMSLSQDQPLLALEDILNRLVGHEPSVAKKVFWNCCISRSDLTKLPNWHVYANKVCASLITKGLLTYCLNRRTVFCLNVCCPWDLGEVHSKNTSSEGAQWEKSTWIRRSQHYFRKCDDWPCYTSHPYCYRYLTRLWQQVLDSWRRAESPPAMPSTPLFM